MYKLQRWETQVDDCDLTPECPLHAYLLSQIAGTTVKSMQAASARGSLHKMTANIYRKLARTGIPLVGQHIVVSLLDRDEDILYLE